uniref:V-set and immunoglobulin domain-containing protein 10 isoform X4 n=1 Tax=Geotrypetes seraphini TaxID=260995 RepID=UPI0014584A01|nr:V-set and immunoglobulin domain-containing protein 10 isoform X4 [Geotrypetes seraphini]
MWTMAGVAFTVCWVWQLLSWVVAGAEVTVIGEVNGSIVLSCNNMTESVENMAWFKSGTLSPILSEGDLRLSLVNKSSLQINGLRLQDEGNYTCKGNLTATDHNPQVQLLIASGPHSINASISPSRSLPNGTLIVTKGSNLDFSCTSQSQPTPSMKWVFKTESTNSDEALWEGNTTSISFSISNIPADYLGNHSCTAQNWLSGRKQTSTLQVLVYYQPKSDPVCWAENLLEENVLHLICKWPGGYPAPHLQWIEEHGGFKPIVNATTPTDVITATLDKSLLQDGQRFKCLGSHDTREEREKAACTLEIKPSNIVGLIVGLVLLFLLAVGLVTAAILYYNPQLFLKGNIFRPGAVDMLVLVDSEDEEEMEEMSATAGQEMTDTVRAENGIISHTTLYHCAPEGYSAELQSDVSMEEERPKPDNESEACSFSSEC